MLLSCRPRNLTLCVLSIVSLVSCALSPITIKGTKLYNDTGSQFYVKGAYRMI